MPALPQLANFSTDPGVFTNVACPPDHRVVVHANAVGVLDRTGTTIVIPWKGGTPNADDLARACHTKELRSG